MRLSRTLRWLCATRVYISHEAPSRFHLNNSVNESPQFVHSVLYPLNSSYTHTEDSEAFKRASRASPFNIFHKILFFIELLLFSLYLPYKSALMELYPISLIHPSEFILSTSFADFCLNVLRRAIWSICATRSVAPTYPKIFVVACFSLPKLRRRRKGSPLKASKHLPIRFGAYTHSGL